MCLACNYSSYSSNAVLIFLEFWGNFSLTPMLWDFKMESHLWIVVKHVRVEGKFDYFDRNLMRKDLNDLEAEVQIFKFRKMGTKDFLYIF